jgi:hypothetical protein
MRSRDLLLLLACLLGIAGAIAIHAEGSQTAGAMALGIAACLTIGHIETGEDGRMRRP